MNVVCRTVWICTAPFPIGGEHINPPVWKRLPDHCTIVISEGGEGGKNILLRLVDRIFQVDATQQWSVEIVVVERVDAENSLPQFQVTVKVRQAGVDIVDKAVIDLNRDIVDVEGALERRFILAGLGIEHVPFHVRVEFWAVRPAVIVERPKESCEDLLAVLTVSWSTVHIISCLAEFRSAAVTQHNFGIRKFCVREDIKDAFGSVCHQSRVCNYFLFSLCAGMRLPP